MKILPVTYHLNEKTWCFECPLYHVDSEKGGECQHYGADSDVSTTSSGPRPEKCKVVRVIVEIQGD